MSKNNNNRTDPPIYIFSGGRGLPANSIVETLLVQFPENKVPVKIIPHVIDSESLDKGLAEVKCCDGIIVHTMVNQAIRDQLISRCKEMGIREFDMVGNLIDYLTAVLNQHPRNEPGLYRKLNMEYFDRIEAIEYSIASDDGLNPRSIHDADIILAGVSRTGKTPLSMYLAMLGWKVANVPLVPGIEPPEDLYLVNPDRVFGLDISTTRLVSHRNKRLADFGVNASTTYTNPRSIQIERQYAQSIFRKGGFAVIKVTNKPIESVANEIIEILSVHFDERSRKNR
jgi:regulator of PEP synthase PpsR (kinase-PPPase family)